MNGLNKKKKNKLAVVICFCIISLFVFSSCDGVNGKDNFVFYLKDKNKMSDTLKLPSGKEIKFFNSLLKENSSSPRIVLWTANNLDNEWYTFDKKIIKKDFKYIGDLVNEYAKSNNWNNGTIYIEIAIPPTGSKWICYDYQKDILYIPKNYEKLLTMYNKFNTFKLDNISKTSEGLSYLINNGFGKMKDGEFETDSNLYNNYTVNIIDDGKFIEYGGRDTIEY